MFKSKKVLLVILVLVLSMFVFTSCGKPSSAEELIEAYQDALNNRDAEALCDIAADAQRGLESVVDYEEYLDDLEDHYGEDFEVEITILDVDEDDDTAEIEVKIRIKSSEGSEREEGTLKAEIIDGDWYWED